MLLVREASALGAGLRSLLRPRPPGQTAPLILCSDGAPLSVGTLPPPLRASQPGPWSAWPCVERAQRPRPRAPRQHQQRGKTADAPEESEDPAVSASRQEARRQAAIDAARAMGRPVPKELMTPPAATPAPAGGAATTPGAAGQRPAVSTPSSGGTAGQVAATPAAPRPSRRRRPAPGRASSDERCRTATDAESSPSRGPGRRRPAPPGSEKYRSGEHPGRRSDAPAEAAAPSPAPAARAPTPPAAAPVVAMPATASDAARLTHQPHRPRAKMPRRCRWRRKRPWKSSFAWRAARRTKRSGPRSLRRLTGARHSAVIQLFRSFVSSPHPAVREAAEGDVSDLWPQLEPQSPDCTAYTASPQ